MVGLGLGGIRMRARRSTGRVTGERNEFFS